MRFTKGKLIWVLAQSALNEIVARHTGRFCYEWRACDSKMKNKWFSILGACVLPPLVGVGVCGGLIHLLKNHELFRPETVTLPTAATTKVRQGKLSEVSAEIRAALPVDAFFAAGDAQDHACHGRKNALKRAAEAAKPKPVVVMPKPANAEPAVVASKPNKPAPIVAVKPQAWRPVIDPISEHWTRLMPRTDALHRRHIRRCSMMTLHILPVVTLGGPPKQPRARSHSITTTLALRELCCGTMCFRVDMNQPPP